MNTSSLEYDTEKTAKKITTRQFRVLADCDRIYQFMIEIYERDWRNGVPAPFFEYAFSSFSYWMDISYSHKNRIWEDDGEIVGFCFYENPVSDIYFSLRPGYEELAPEMIAYADAHMPHDNEGIQLILFEGQDALMKAAQQAGYRKMSEEAELVLDFAHTLDALLPAGFYFVEPKDYDMAAVDKCCWKGFDHEAAEGAWQGQYVQNGYLLQAAPHATMDLAVAIADENGEYACWAGMWWTPENKLAYMEPLCTIPQYRHMGLASAALSELYRRMKMLGATHMTGGMDAFYRKIGFEPAVTWTFWKRG